jgi:hypothetical protein
MLLKASANVVNNTGIEKAATVIWSSIFNIRYYQGIADGLGGRAAFFSGIKNNAVRNRKVQSLVEDKT